MSYALTDRVTVVGGVEQYRGRDGSLFQLMRPNTLGYAEARWGF